MPTATAESCASSTPLRSQHHAIAGASVSACRGGLGVGGSAELDPSEQSVLVREHDADAPGRSVDPEDQHYAGRRSGEAERAERGFERGAPRRPHDATGDNLDVAAIIVVVVQREPHVDPVEGKHARDGFAPLDDRDPALEQFLEAEVVQFLNPVEAVHVDVRDRHAAVVLLHDRERRARHLLRDAEPTRQALGERGLARTEVAGQHDEITDAQLRTDRFTDRLGLGRALRRERCHRRLPRDERALDVHEVGARFGQSPTTGTQDGGRMQRRDEYRLVSGAREGELLTAQLRDPFLGLQQQLRGEVAERDDDPRPDQLELTVEPRARTLRSRRVAGHGFPVVGTSRRSRCRRRRG